MSEELHVCPRCDCDYKGHGSLSRRDNQTDICPTCGTEEAINDSEPIKQWVMINDDSGLTTSGDRLDRMIREKKFQNIRRPSADRQYRPKPDNLPPVPTPYRTFAD